MSYATVIIILVRRRCDRVRSLRGLCENRRTRFPPRLEAPDSLLRENESHKRRAPYFVGCTNDFYLITVSVSTALQAVVPVIIVELFSTAVKFLTSRGFLR